jgi:putative addiction module CopG family antidote
MPIRKINLTEHCDQFITNEVETGLYRSPNEVIQAALHLLEQRTRDDHGKLALLRTLADEAFQQIDQGQGIKIRSKRELAALVHGIGRRVATKCRERE